MNVNVKFKKLHAQATTPSYAHPGDAGLDFYASEKTVLESGIPTRVPTGIALELPEGYVSLFWDKSGLSTKHGLKTLGGVIEHTYRGEYQVGIINLGKEPFTFEVGDKVAQLLIQPIATASLEEAIKFSETQRGSGGFGSTGE